MKNFLALALVTMLTLFVLAACGGDNDDTSAAGNDNELAQGNQTANNSPSNNPEQVVPLDEPEDNIYGDFVFSVEAEEVIITRYTGNATDLIIPDTINGLPVRIIGASAFFNAAPLTDIVIPDSVTRIERGAFGGHFPITSIVLSNEVVYIGDGAFGYLSIESIFLPESVRYIGAVAFTGPQRLYVPPIVMEQATISEHAFSSVWEVVVRETTDEAELATVEGTIDTTLIGSWSMVMSQPPPGRQISRDEQQEMDYINALLLEAEIIYSFNADGTGVLYTGDAGELGFDWHTYNDQLFILLAGHQTPSEIRFIVDEPRLTFLSDGEDLMTILARPDAVADIRPTYIDIDHEFIEFGGYTWIVLDEQDGRSLILSEYILDAMPFSDSFAYTSWADSAVRRWLNDDFYNTFNEEDRARISEDFTFAMPNPWWGTASGEHTRDNIFLLSADEVLNYFGNSGERPAGNQILSDRYNSNRAAQILPELHNAGWRIDYWWTRTTGISDVRIVFIGGTGGIQTAGQPFGTTVGVRPAMWIYR